MAASVLLQSVRLFHRNLPFICPHRCISLRRRQLLHANHYQADDGLFSVLCYRSSCKKLDPSFQVRACSKLSNVSHVASGSGSESDAVPQLPRTTAAMRTARSDKMVDGPSLQDFIIASNQTENLSSEDFSPETVPYLRGNSMEARNRKVYFETYGCQMNVNDTEIAWAILKENGFQKVDDVLKADVILAVTCAIRENAEQKIWNRLEYFQALKKRRRKNQPPLKVGLLGCMAERLKKDILERTKIVDIVAGPDAYRDLPRLLSVAHSGQSAINVILSFDETYADVVPVRLSEGSKLAFISIMRGCDNMCSYCIVPFTRGRERSRPTSSILEEVKILSDQGVKELTLLGQNVNSYRDTSEAVYYGHETAAGDAGQSTHLAEGFSTIYKHKKGGRRFADLLEKVSEVDPEMRIRFTSPHPKDFPDEVLHLIRDRDNICSQLHMPAQSGNTEVLKRMRRGYTRETYLDLVDHIRSTIPQVSLSSDFITGFCGETEAEHEDTLSLLRLVRYNYAYLFAYSMRTKTHAYHKMADDVPEDIKQRRLREVIALCRQYMGEANKSQVGRHQLVLVQGASKRSDKDLVGRNDGNIKVIIPDVKVPCCATNHVDVSSIKPGDYVAVHIDSSNSQILKGTPVYHTTLKDFHLHEEKSARGLSAQRYPFAPGWREAVAVKCLAQGHKAP